MSYWDALEHMEKGERIARVCWEEGRCLFYVRAQDWSFNNSSGKPTRALVIVAQHGLKRGEHLSVTYEGWIAEYEPACGVKPYFGKLEDAGNQDWYVLEPFAPPAQSEPTETPATFDFSQALEHLKAGRKVRRLRHEVDSYLHAGKYEAVQVYSLDFAGTQLVARAYWFKMEDSQATDWTLVP